MEQIIRMIREAEAALAQGQTTAQGVGPLDAFPLLSGRGIQLPIGPDCGV